LKRTIRSKIFNKYFSKNQIEFDVEDETNTLGRISVRNSSRGQGGRRPQAKPSVWLGREIIRRRSSPKNDKYHRKYLQNRTKIPPG
jgi:hypothetical protein